MTIQEEETFSDRHHFFFLLMLYIYYNAILIKTVTYYIYLYIFNKLIIQLLNLSNDNLFIFYVLAGPYT